MIPNKKPALFGGFFFGGLLRFRLLFDERREFGVQEEIDDQGGGDGDESNPWLGWDGKDDE